MKKAKQRLQNVACDWYEGVSEEKKIGEYAKTRKKQKIKDYGKNRENMSKKTKKKERFHGKSWENTKNPIKSCVEENKKMSWKVLKWMQKLNWSKMK